jgi:hypothetical protein
MNDMSVNERSTASSSDAVPDELWSAIAHRRTEYYVPKWKRYAAGESTFPSWHWPALFLTGWWALYRKSWAGAAALFFLPLGLVFAVGLLGGLLQVADVGTGAMTLLAVLAAWLLPPTLANGFYYRKACKLVAEARRQSADLATQRAYVTAKGGTSGGMVAVICIFAAVTGIGVLAGIAVPAYQDYVVRAKVASALAAVAPVQQQIVDTYQRSHTLPQVSRTALDGVPGAEFVEDLAMDDHGVLTISLIPLAGRSSHVLLSPRRQGDAIAWTCRSGDMQPRHLPPQCRM